MEKGKEKKEKALGEPPALKFDLLLIFFSPFLINNFSVKFISDSF